jgi:type I restriction enzyme S subunit
MNDWKQESLRDICTLINRGISPKYVESGTVILNQKCIRDNRINYTECKYTSSEKKVAKEKYLQELDILVNSTGTGTLGRTAQIKSLNQDTFVDTHITIVRANNKMVDPAFMAYQISLKEPEIVSLGKGATNQQELGRDELGSIIINLPPLPIQKRIASILSAYDDLIENNLKRIKLLEEIAQRTYEEWFVKFRINGEQLLMDEETGLPVGWERKSMSSIGDFINGFAFKPSDFLQIGKPIIKIKEMKNGIGNDTPLNDGSRVPSKYLIKRGDLLFSWSGSLEVVIWRGIEGWLNQHLFKVVPKKDIPMVFLHQSLLFVLNEFNNLTTGSTMKHIKRKELDFVTVPVPNTRVISDFDKIISPVQQQILNLSNQIQLLKQSRDILLPRLMSGTINVES